MIIGDLMPWAGLHGPALADTDFRTKAKSNF
jgi:hypothetical protein